MRRYCLTSMDARTCAPILDRRVTLCRDARSVRPSPLKVTALKLKDNGLYVSSFDNVTTDALPLDASERPYFLPPHFHYPYDLLHF